MTGPCLEPEQTRHQFQFIIDASAAGCRLDHFLVEKIKEHGELSRASIQMLLRNGKISVNQSKVKAGYKLHADDLILVHLPEPEPIELKAEPVHFEILFEDRDVIVIVKPPGLVVHPACGHTSGTLVNGLLYHCQDLVGIGGEIRPGIVHRLDKDTSGVMVAAKNDFAHQGLIQQFKEKKVSKIYHALLARTPRDNHGMLQSLIGRHPVHRKRMAVVEKNGRLAITHWRVIEQFSGGICLAELKIDTGRTHQIRVHMAHLGCPVLGDPVYGTKRRDPAEITPSRQCLHASFLSFYHPVQERVMEFEAPLWEDMQTLLDRLRQMSMLGRTNMQGGSGD